MLNWDCSSQKQLSCLATTDQMSLYAPLQHPLDTEEHPPQLTLDQSDWSPFTVGWGFEPATTRKASIDQPYSILGFIQRRISEKRRRVNSQELNKRAAHTF